MTFESLPGGTLLGRGIEDLAVGTRSVEALLVMIGAPRLRELGIDVHSDVPDPELELFQRLVNEYGDAAHSRYNSLIRQLVSFERALESGIR